MKKHYSTLPLSSAILLFDFILLLQARNFLYLVEFVESLQRG